MANDTEIPVTSNYNFPLMGNTVQLNELIYRQNIETIGEILDTIIRNEPSNENLVDGLKSLTTSQYSKLSYETESPRNLYFVKRKTNGS